MPEVRFLRSRAGARIAYSVEGAGPAIVCVPPWTAHLRAQQELSGYRAFVHELARDHTVIQFDRWGTGLSSRDRGDMSVVADVDTLIDVFDHLRLRRCALFGPSHGGTIAAEFAASHPRRVSHLVIYGAETRLTSPDTWPAMRQLMVDSWDVACTSIAAVATEGAGQRDVDNFASMLRVAATPEVMVALQEAAMAHEPQLPATYRRIRLPTLVLHRQEDSLVPPASAAEIATEIPGARLELLAGRPHVHFVGDVTALARRITGFLSGGVHTASARVSPREAEVLDLIASGCSNQEAAEQLVLSVRTVERHLLNAYAKLGAHGRAEATAKWLFGRSEGHQPPA
jgi:pimeloyl-ACP methyl ester carboxylesterase/DNA-binding CsgD family transcriptional regulator